MEPTTTAVIDAYDAVTIDDPDEHKRILLALTNATATATTNNSADILVVTKYTEFQTKCLECIE